MDYSAFESVNRWSAHNGWSHAFFRTYANLGIGVFAVGLILAGLIGLRSDPQALARSLWAGAVAVGLRFAVRRVGWIMVGAAILMAFTRVFVGAHYPGDVVTGLAFGGVIAAAGIPLADRVLTPWCQRLRTTSITSRFVAPG